MKTKRIKTYFMNFLIFCMTIIIASNGLFFTNAYADTLETPKGFEYVINEDNTVTITGYHTTEYSDSGLNFVIPNEIDGYPVVELGEGAFPQWNFRSIEIPYGIKKIGAGAFYYCSSVENIEIPASVVSIGTSAFCGCNSLTSITIPASVEYIEGDPFYACLGLAEINVDNNNAFYTSKEGVLFDKDMTELICCPAKKRGAYSIPAGVLSIRDSAFVDCTSLTEVDIPSSVNQIGEGAFLACEKLQSIQLPEGIEAIKDSTFLDCYSLEEIEIPQSVISIGNWAFENCQSLKRISISDSLTSIGVAGFRGCNSLIELRVDENNKFYASVDGVLYNKELSKLLYCPGGKEGECIIPESVTGIDTQAFLNCSKLTSISIPANSTWFDSIYDSMNWQNGLFSGCSSLEEIKVDENHPNISSQDGAVFNKDKTELYYCCPGGKNFKYTIPSTVNSIYNGAFENNTLVMLEIPVSVTKISNYSFWDSSVDHIIYNGSEASWNEISGSESLSEIEKHFEANGDAVKEIDSIAPTCEYGGYTVFKCSLCQQEFREFTSESLGHLYEDGKCIRCGTLHQEIYAKAFYDGKKTVYIDIYAINVKSYDIGIGYDKNEATPESHVFSSIHKEINFGDSVPYEVFNYNAHSSGIGDYSCFIGFSPDEKAISFNGLFISEKFTVQSEKLPKLQLYKNTAGNTETVMSEIPINDTFSFDIKEDNTVSIIGADESISEALIPDSIYDCPIKNIASAAFSQCKKIQKIVIPDSVTEIAEDAFEGCDQLVIYCNENSAAHQYAKNHGISFELNNSAPTETVYGDLDGNGSVDAADALQILKIAAKLEPSTEDAVQAGDVDGSGSLGADDALLVLQKAAKIINVFPAEKT